MIRRADHVRAVLRTLRSFPVTGILGPRQVGKTTLAGQVAAARGGGVHRFDLEDPRDRDRLANPMAALLPLRGLVVLDEIQHRPELFPVLRVLADRRPSPARFLVLGSASPGLLRQSSESLAGRIAYHELGGLGLAETGAGTADRLWLRGGMPRSFLARGDADSFEHRRWLVRSFLERDAPALGAPGGTETLRRFWTMLAHFHGQVWNASELGRSLGVTDKTARGYLDFLAAVYMVRVLPPWHENLAKRQVKAPKIYFRDTGILHFLSGIRTPRALLDDARCGASWEGFALEEVARLLRADPAELHHWRTHQGTELDLLFQRGGRRIGFEFKRATRPGLSASMAIALEDLGLQRLLVVHPGSEAYPLGHRVEAVPLSALAERLRATLRRSP